MEMRTRSLLVPALLAAVLLPGPARADITLTAGAVQVLLAEPELDPLAEQDWLHAGRVSAGLDLFEGLGLDLAYEGGRLTAPLFEDWDSALELDGLLGGVHYRHEALEWLWPYARVDLGAFKGALSIRTGDTRITAEDWTFFCAASLGLQLGLPKRLVREWLSIDEDSFFADLSIALDLSVGWAMYGRLDFDHARMSGPGGVRYEESAVALGDLGLDGFRSGIALSVHF